MGQPRRLSCVAVPDDELGGLVTAEELARVTATNLHEEFATVVMTADVLRGA